MYLTDKGQLEFQVNNKSNKHYNSLHALLECSGLTPVMFNELLQKQVGDDCLAKVGDAYTITALLGLKYTGGESTGLKNGFFTVSLYMEKLMQTGMTSWMLILTFEIIKP